MATDPVSAYAEAVCSGDLTACKWVRLACERHRLDVEEHGTKRSEGLWFDRKAASDAIAFFPKFLRFYEGEFDGKPFALEPWQQFLIGCLFGWKRGNVRRFRTAYIETAKGNGKSPIAAGIGIFGLLADNEAGAEIYAAATTREQAGILFRDAKAFVEGSETLRKKLNVGVGSINYEGKNSFFRPISSEHRGLDGKRPHFALIDEIHEHPDPIVVDKMRAGTKARRNALIFEITNSGSDLESVCYHHHEYSLKVLEGLVDDPSWFAYVCSLDKDDSWTDEAVWPKANPGLGTVLPAQYLREQVREAQGMPSKQNIVKRLNFCVWTQSHVTWIPPDRWDACRVPAVATENTSRPCAAGLDLSSKLDLSAFVIALRIDDDPNAPSEDVAIETQTDDGQPTTIKLTLNFSVELVPFFWLPEETLIERVQTERIPYDVWRMQGHLRVTAGGVIDHQLIYDTIVQAWKTFRIQKLGLDERDATMMFVKLRDEARLGGNVLGIGQGRRLSEAYKLLEVLIRSRRLRHDGQPVLGWCFANAEPKHDRLGALWIEKPAEVKRIDGAVAAAMAVSQLMVLPATRGNRFGVMVV